MALNVQYHFAFVTSKSGAFVKITTSEESIPCVDWSVKILVRRCTEAAISHLLPWDSGFVPKYERLCHNLCEGEQVNGPFHNISVKVIAVYKFTVERPNWPPPLLGPNHDVVS